jgi:DNA-directed RNA polymerase specialized sigma24 family protein
MTMSQVEDTERAVRAYEARARPVLRGPKAELEEERSLLAAAWTGDERAFGRLTQHHLQGLELYCRLMLGCPAEAHEAVQETLLRGWCGLDRLLPPASARIWLYRLATDVCLEAHDGADESAGPRPLDRARDDDR